MISPNSNAPATPLDPTELKTFPIVLCVALGLRVYWHLYLNKGDNRQKAQGWLKSGRRSTKVFWAIMAILALAAFGQIIVDICQSFFGWK
jgi:hypothetical protein